MDRMNRIQQHRGPDDEGIFADFHCILGHRRLSIIDLSRDGHQPFFSDDGRLHLTYNGEIYNYIELRAELEDLGWTFRTKTDTEVLLKAYQQYREACLKKLNGIFAFAIYDTQTGRLFLARDHFGIKPLYYMAVDSKFYFASEIKALRALPGLSLSLNPQAVFDFLVFNRTDVFDETFVREIKRLPKGHYGILDRNGLKLVQWWDPRTFAAETAEEPDRRVMDTIEQLFVSSAQLQMRSDVPVGSCLSGGLDSSILIGALFTHTPLNGRFATFTSSFPQHPVDETRYIDSLNKRYPFRNYRTYPTAESAFQNFERFVYTLDEPTTRASVYAQYEVMRLAREHGITVLLDGQGGDENFAGYPYFHGFHLYGLARAKRVGALLREIARMIERHQDVSAYHTFLFQWLPDAVKRRALLRTVPYMASDFFHAYADASRIYNEFFDAPDLHASLVRHFQYKLEHLLRFEDRNSMAFSIEARVPYLDHRLVEYVLGVRDNLKIRAGTTKYLQKQALGRYTVPEILERKDKIGFETPMDEWMATPAWARYTEENMQYLKAAMPGCFSRSAGLPAGGESRWKINHLAAWHRMVFR